MDESHHTAHPATKFPALPQIPSASRSPLGHVFDISGLAKYNRKARSTCLVKDFLRLRLSLSHGSRQEPQPVPREGKEEEATLT